MSKYMNGIKAGFVATAVLSLLMLAKGMMGLMPNLDVISMLSRIMGLPGAYWTGWLAHFFIGTVVWGGLFALLVPKIPGASYAVKGMVFGAGAWLLMMLLVMPMAHAGLFGILLGMMAPIMTLMLHLIYGAVLGFAYGSSADRIAAANMNSPL